MNQMLTKFSCSHRYKPLTLRNEVICYISRKRLLSIDFENAQEVDNNCLKFKRSNKLEAETMILLHFKTSDRQLQK